jgi:hypothetical protein
MHIVTLEGAVLYKFVLEHTKKKDKRHTCKVFTKINVKIYTQFIHKYEYLHKQYPLPLRYPLRNPKAEETEGDET